MRVLTSFVASLFFGAGLAVSGMIDPARVHGFLDVAGGDWDPTLAFVMVGAIAPMVVAWLIRARLTKPFLDTSFSLPDSNDVTRRLIAGAAIFGTGWGLAGLCPGPAIADVALQPLCALPFVAAMMFGFFVETSIDIFRSKHKTKTRIVF